MLIDLETPLPRTLTWLAPLCFAVACARPAATPTAAPTAPATTEAPEVATVERDLLLWKVSKGDQVSHFLGTCHVPLSLTDVMPDPRPLVGARLAFVELRMADVEPQEALAAVWDDEADIAGTLGRERFVRLGRRLGMEGMPAPMLDRMKPYVVAVTAATADLTPEGDAVGAQGSAAPAPPILDTTIAVVADMSGVEVRPVETFAQQMALLEGMHGLLDGDDEVADLTEGMARLCYRGELDVAEALEATAYQPLLRDRNVAWFPRMLPELEQGGAFVAVGAAHMLGPDGLLALAEAEGFTVERLRGAVPDRPLPEAVATPSPQAPREVPLLDLDLRDGVGRRMAEAACAEPSSRCLEPDPDRCVARLGTALGQCIDQAGIAEVERLQAMTDEDFVPIVGCGMTTFTGRILATGELPADPACTEALGG